MAKEVKKKSEGRGNSTMNIKIIEYIVQAVKNISEICNKVVDASDPKKYAEGVNALNENVDETYAKMRELITQDDTLTATEKVEKLEKLAESQQAALRACKDDIKDNREHIAKIVTEVFAALATCGVSCIPKVIKGCKKACVAMPDDVLIESDIPIDYIEEAKSNNENANESNLDLVH